MANKKILKFINFEILKYRKSFEKIKTKILKIYKKKLNEKIKELITLPPFVYAQNIYTYNIFI